MNIKSHKVNKCSVKKEEKKKKGEFIEQRKINKRRAAIYDKINLAFNVNRFLTLGLTLLSYIRIPTI